MPDDEELIADIAESFRRAIANDERQPTDAPDDEGEVEVVEAATAVALDVLEPSAQENERPPR